MDGYFLAVSLFRSCATAAAGVAFIARIFRRERALKLCCFRPLSRLFSLNGRHGAAFRFLGAGSIQTATIKNSARPAPSALSPLSGATQPSPSTFTQAKHSLHCIYIVPVRRYVTPNCCGSWLRCGQWAPKSDSFILLASRAAHSLSPAADPFKEREGQRARATKGALVGEPLLPPSCRCTMMVERI